MVTTFVGDPTGNFGYVDGVGTNVLLNAPSDAAFTSSGILYVADASNFAVRMVLTRGYFFLSFLFYVSFIYLFFHC